MSRKDVQAKQRILPEASGRMLLALSTILLAYAQQMTAIVALVKQPDNFRLLQLIMDEVTVRYMRCSEYIVKSGEIGDRQRFFVEPLSRILHLRTMPALCNALRYTYAAEYALRSDNALRNISGQKFYRHAAACFDAARTADDSSINGFAKRIAARADKVAPEGTDVSSADHIDLANAFVDHWRLVKV